MAPTFRSANESPNERRLTTPSPGPPRLVKAPTAGHPLPQGGEGRILHLPRSCSLHTLFPTPYSLFPVSFHTIEAELCVAMANEAVPAQVSVLFFKKTVARVFRNHQGSRIQQM